MRFEEPVLLSLLVLLLPVALLLWRRSGRLLAVSRTVVLLLLVVAAANPLQAQEASSEVEVPRVTFVQDATGSMDMFDGFDGDLSGLRNETDLRTMTLRGNSSPVGDALMEAASRGGAVVLYSDGRVTEGRSLEEAVLYAARRNVSIYAVRPGARSGDVSVEVVGPKNVVAGENRYSVDVRSAEPSSYSLEVRLDGVNVLSRDVEGHEGLRRFNVTLEIDEGRNVIEAEVFPEGDDHFESNDRFSRAVWGAPKPRVLLVNGGSSLRSVLESGYRVTGSSGVEGPEGYRAIVLDDVAAGELDGSELDALSSFVVEGGGLVVVGGRSSYNFGDYLNSSVENVLPVRSSPSRFFGGLNLVIVIDVSDSTRQGPFGEGIEDTTILDLEKSNAIHLVDEMERGDRVAAVTFGGAGYTVLPSRDGWVSAEDSGLLVEELRRIRAERGGGTLLSEGLREAARRLGAVGGSKTVVVLTDGGIKDVETAREDVEALGTVGAELVFVKVRSGTTGNENIDTLAELTDTPLYEVERGEVASVDLSDEDAPPGVGDRAEFGLSTSEVDHFVTRGLSLDSSVTGYNDVTPKPASDLLVVTDTGRPVLTTWSFGLGRVAALSTDDGTAWAPGLYSGDPLLITRTVSWAVEDPRAREGVLVTADDGWVGSSLTVKVEAGEAPSLVLGEQPVRLGRRDGYYSGTVVPLERGVYALAGYPVAVNYPLEYRETGFDEGLEQLLRATGGGVAPGVNVTREELLAGAAVRSTEEVSLRWLPLAAALAIFAFDVSLRRWREVKGRG